MIILRIGSVLGEKFKILEIGPCAGSDRVGGRGLKNLIKLMNYIQYVATQYTKSAVLVNNGSCASVPWFCCVS